MLEIDARADDLKIKLIQDINAANLPACILYYLLDDLLRNVSNQLDNEIKRERDEYRKEIEAKNTEKKAPAKG